MTMKLLIIEDEASLQELMTSALKKDGYIVEQGKTGEMFDNDSISRLLGYPVVAAQDAMGNVRVKLEVESTFRDLYDTMNKEEEA